MGKHTKLGSSRLDHYYFLAKSMGFRARSAFKILQLNKKYDFLSTAHAYVELCAAPGGALQAAQQAMPVGSIIIGVDLVKIKPIPGVQTLQADITSQYCFNQLKKMLNGTPLDVVFCDGAPNVSGEFKLDCYNQNVLVLYALKSACTLLRQGGTFISKVFRGEYMMNIVYVLNQLFGSVELNKPDSSRTQSAEIFVVCRQFKGGIATIDEKMFDPQVVLQSQKQSQEGMSLKALNKQLDHNVRHRVGYQDSLVNKVTDIVTFITSQKPIEILAKVNSILFDADIQNDYRFKDLKEQFEQGIGIEFNNRVIRTIQEFNEAQQFLKDQTDKEMIEQLKDVKQLSRTALQNVINYHRKMYGALCRKIISEVEVQVQEFDDDNNKQKTTEELVAEQQQQLIHQQKLIARKNQKEKEKKLRKFAQYDKENVENQAIEQQEVVQYNLDALDDPETLRRFLACEEISESEESINQEEQQQYLVNDDKRTAIDLNDNYLDNVDEEMNQMYNDYEKIKEEQKEQEKEKVHLENLKEGIDDTEEQWFKQKEFDDFADSFKLPRENLMKHKQKQERRKRLLQEQKEKEQKQAQQEDDNTLIREIQIIDNNLNQNQYISDSSDEDNLLDEEAEELEEQSESNQELIEDQYPEGDMSIQKMLNKKNIDNTAMKLALATKMLHRKGRKELEDSAYNKRFYECNEENLPDWFVKDEKEHCQVARPISAAEIQQAKLKLKELQEMPRTKKEREALARKKMHSQQKLNAMQGKIQEVVQSDMTEREKVRKLRQLQKAAEPKQKTKKIVQGNTGRVISKGKKSYGVQFVDKRDKHERRVLKQREKRQGKKFNFNKKRR